jgi:organic hydroperoxide reductase OsmC/OhrA
MTTTIRHREFAFPVRVAWDGGRRTSAVVDGKAPLPIATPPEFKGTDPELWSPEDAFVAAAGSCLAVTIAGMAERRQVPMHALSVDAVGTVGQRPDGRFGFTRIDQTVAAETDDEHAELLRELIAQAEKTCLVAVSLDLPVETTVEIAAAAAYAGT